MNNISLDLYILRLLLEFGCSNNYFTQFNIYSLTKLLSFATFNVIGREYHINNELISGTLDPLGGVIRRSACFSHGVSVIVDAVRHSPSSTSPAAAEQWLPEAGRGAGSAHACGRSCSASSHALTLARRARASNPEEVEQELRQQEAMVLLGQRQYLMR